MINKSQSIVLFSVGLLFCLLYFGLSTKSSDRSEIEMSRSLMTESTDIQALLPAAKKELSADQLALISALEATLREEQNDSSKIELTEQLAGKWYDWGHPEISGYYAEQIAERVNTAQAWSIAGTTYAIGAQRSEEEKIRSYCNGRAIKSFEAAISLEPAVIQHQLNLAICYADNPPADQPMKGIQMLLALNTKHPEEIGVLNTLARFGLQTGQFAKAAQRLEKVLSIEPNNKTATCLLVQAYQGLGETAKAQTYAQKCQETN